MRGSCDRVDRCLFVSELEFGVGFVGCCHIGNFVKFVGAISIGCMLHLVSSSGRIGMWNAIRRVVVGNKNKLRCALFDG